MNRLHWFRLALCHSSTQTQPTYRCLSVWLLMLVSNGPFSPRKPHIPANTSKTKAYTHQWHTPTEPELDGWLLQSYSDNLVGKMGRCDVWIWAKHFVNAWVCLHSCLLVQRQWALPSQILRLAERHHCVSCHRCFDSASSWGEREKKQTSGHLQARQEASRSPWSHLHTAGAPAWAGTHR